MWEAWPRSSAGVTNLDEIVAIRLYTGPAYQPINEFLRQIGRVTGEFRQCYVRARPLLGGHLQKKKNEGAGFWPRFLRKISTILSEQ